MPQTIAQSRANLKYQKSHKRQFAFLPNLEYDADVIEVLENHENKQGYIKALIRDDIKNGLPIARSVKAPDPKIKPLKK